MCMHRTKLHPFTILLLLGCARRRPWMTHLPQRMPGGFRWLPTAVTCARRRHASKQRSWAATVDCRRLASSPAAPDCKRLVDWAAGDAYAWHLPWITFIPA